MSGERKRQDALLNLLNALDHGGTEARTYAAALAAYRKAVSR